MRVPRYTSTVAVFCLDRKDMFYQTRATVERAESNLMGPSFAWRTFERGGLGRELEELRARVPHA